MPMTPAEKRERIRVLNDLILKSHELTEKLDKLQKMLHGLRQFGGYKTNINNSVCVSQPNNDFKVGVPLDPKQTDMK